MIVHLAWNKSRVLWDSPQTPRRLASTIPIPIMFWIQLQWCVYRFSITLRSTLGPWHFPSLPVGSLLLFLLLFSQGDLHHLSQLQQMLLATCFWNNLWKVPSFLLADRLSSVLFSSVYHHLIQLLFYSHSVIFPWSFLECEMAVLGPLPNQPLKIHRKCSGEKRKSMNDYLESTVWVTRSMCHLHTLFICPDAVV